MIENNKSHPLLFEKSKMGITHPEGILWLKEVQLAGKRKMNIQDFVNGLKTTDDIHLMKY